MGLVCTCEHLWESGNKVQVWGFVVMGVMACGSMIIMM